MAELYFDLVELIFVFAFPFSVFLLSLTYVKILRGGSQNKIYFFSILSLLYGVIPAVIILYTFNGGFGSGTFLCTFLPFIGIASFFMPFIAQNIVYKDKQLVPNYLRISNLIVGGTLAFSIFASPFLMWEIADACDEVHRKQASEIITAIVLYKEQYSNYPNKDDLLSKNYIKEWPTPECFKPKKFIFPDIADYHIRECESDEIYLSISSTMGGSILLYDFLTEKWLATDSLGGCYCDCHE